MVANYSKGWGNGSLAAIPDAIPAFLDISRGNAGLNSTISTQNANLTDLERALNRSAAFDGVENVSSAYGYYADDLQCTQLGQVHAVNGHKEAPFAGFYKGRERIAAACHTSYGFPNMSDERSNVSFHWRMQPVILVSEDGKSVCFLHSLFLSS
jgi:hypothetical protein